jgi:hypothetical protein
MVMRWRSPLREPRNKRRGRDFWSCHGKITSLPSSLFQPSSPPSSLGSLAHTENFLYGCARLLFFVDKTWWAAFSLSAGWESNILHHFTSLESKQWANKSPAMGGSGPEKAENALAVWSGDGRRILSASSCWLRIYLSLLRGSVCVCVSEAVFCLARGEMDPLPERRWRDNSPNCFHMAFFICVCGCGWRACSYLLGPKWREKSFLLIYVLFEKKSIHTLGVYFAFWCTHLSGKKSDGDKKVMIIILFLGTSFLLGT